MKRLLFLLSALLLFAVPRTSFAVSFVDTGTVLKYGMPTKAAVDSVVAPIAARLAEFSATVAEGDTPTSTVEVIDLLRPNTVMDQAVITRFSLTEGQLLQLRRLRAEYDGERQRVYESYVGDELTATLRQTEDTYVDRLLSALQPERFDWRAPGNGNGNGNG